MPTSAVVHVTVDADVKEEATAIYAEAGLTLSEAFRLLLVRTVAQKALPFEPWTPNTETVESMMEARNGKLVQFDSIEDLMADLHAED